MVFSAPPRILVVMALTLNSGPGSVPVITRRSPLTCAVARAPAVELLICAARLPAISSKLPSVPLVT